MVRAETRIDSAQLGEAFEEEPGPHQQNEGKRHFTDHQQIAHRPAAGAGAMPNRKLLASEIATAKASTPGSSASDTVCERSWGIRFFRKLKHQSASNMPSKPPPTASSALSVSIWRTMRARAAPSAVRTAISRWRPVARARS